MVVAWDRDAEISSDITYDDIVNYSSARTFQLGNLTSGKIISSSLYPTTMGEKSEMWSTDKVMGFRKGTETEFPSETEQYDNVVVNMSLNTVQWSPVFLIAVPKNAGFKAKLTVIATLRCRGVRFQRRWLGAGLPQPEPEPEPAPKELEQSLGRFTVYT